MPRYYQSNRRTFERRMKFVQQSLHPYNKKSLLFATCIVRVRISSDSRLRITNALCRYWRCCRCSSSSSFWSGSCLSCFRSRGRLSSCFLGRCCCLSRCSSCSRRCCCCYGAGVTGCAILHVWIENCRSGTIVEGTGQNTIALEALRISRKFKVSINLDQDDCGTVNSF